MHKSLLLEAKHLRKSVKDHPILVDVSFSIYPKEIVGLLGHNGAGKSTAFHIAMGLIHPDAGSLTWDQTDITSFPVHKRAHLGMGYLPQEPSLFKSLTVEENLLCILETLDLSSKERKQRLFECLEEMHLTSLAKKRTLYLSGGEKRRVEIARCLTRKPRLLLLDEPFANIDPMTISEVKTLIQKLREKGISIFITDHNAREIFSIVDRSYLMSEGKMLTHGTSEELINSQAARMSYLGTDFIL